MVLTALSIRPRENPVLIRADPHRHNLGRPTQPDRGHPPRLLNVMPQLPLVSCILSLSLSLSVTTAAKQNLVSEASRPKPAIYNGARQPTNHIAFQHILVLARLGVWFTQYGFVVCSARNEVDATLHASPWKTASY